MSRAAAVSSSFVAAAAPRPGARAGRWAQGVPAFVEALLVVLAIATLWPLFERMAPLAAGRDGRFLERGIAVLGLPAPALPAACDEVGAWAEASVATVLCRSTRRTSTPAPTLMPNALRGAIARAGDAFDRPLRDAEARVLRLQAESGDTGLRDGADAVAAIEADIAQI